ncbi:MAG TPA: endonuclease/exonuclease/phosphatase family protein [Bryobacteraceae bacterium]|nr:endonuclease/exonuclease/phosphatase family protein [Bryobacteraceae bacterium]
MRSGKALIGILLALNASAQLRVASLNVDKKSGPKFIGSLSRQADLRRADILLLQEVVDSPRFHVAAEAANALGMRFAFAPAFRLRGDMDEGLAILSRYPLESRTVIPLARNRLHFRNRIRIALAVTARTPLGPVRVIDIHLDNRINSDLKLAQLGGIWPEVERSAAPVIVGGDFNTGNFYWASHVVPVPGEQKQREDVLDAMREHGFRTTLGSGPATYHIPGQKLDWIFVRGLEPGASGVTPIRFSDHNSVWMAVAPR